VAVAGDIKHTLSQHQSQIRNAGLIIVAALIVLKQFETLNTLVPDRIATSIMVAIVLVIALDLSSSLEKLSHHMEAGVRVGNQGTLYTDARTMCKAQGVKQVTLYHYSSSLVQGLVHDLLDDGCSVRLFLQKPETAAQLGANYQASRILQMLTQLRNWDAEGRKQAIKVLQCSVPLTVRGAIFGDQFLILGWYSYGTFIREIPGAEHDTLDVRGHDSFGVLLTRQSPDFTKAVEFLNNYEKRLAAEEVTL
jgi:hypothetical protein